MDRAIELAADHGIGLVALVMPTTGCAAAATAGRRRKKVYWHLLDQLHRRNAAVGRKRCRIGTNPLIVAIPSTPITMVICRCSLTAC